MIYVTSMYIMERVDVYHGADRMKVSKWGNSLAIRIPTDVASRLGLKEGDEVDLQPSDTNGIELLRLASRRERIDRLRELLKGRLPADYRFDREAANARR